MFSLMVRRAFLLLTLSTCWAQDSPRTKATANYNNLYKNGIPFLGNAPNAFMARMIEGHKPGRALDIGMGQGRNAIYLAEKGWQVTGIELAQEGIRATRAAASRKGVKIDAVMADALGYDYGTAKWDLIVATYIHGVMTRIAERLRLSLRPGGLLVIEGFLYRPEAPSPTTGTPFGFRKNELLHSFEQLRILHYEDTTDRADWAPSRPRPIVRFAGRKE